MNGSLTEFALRLARDPEALARFRSSPEAALVAMQSAGLSARVRRVMQSGDHRQIADALAAESRGLAFAEHMEEGGEEVMEAPAPEHMEAPAPEHMEAPAPEFMEAEPPEVMEAK